MGWLLFQNLSRLPTLNLGSTSTWISIFSGFSLYCISQFIGALAWRGVLSAYGVRLQRWRAESQLLVSQIGKYIPGNVAHLIGRFALAHKDGIITPIISISMLIEVVMLLVVGIGFLGVLLIAAPWAFTGLFTSLQLTETQIYRALGMLCMLLIIVIVSAILYRKSRFQTEQPMVARALIWPAILHAVNFVLLGVSLYFASRATAPGTEVSLVFATAVFTVAWIVGFLVPGAPGGIGIRDGIIVLGLGAVIGEPAGLATALLHRGISIFGDGATFAGGYLMRRKTTQKITVK